METTISQTDVGLLASLRNSHQPDKFLRVVGDLFSTKQIENPAVQKKVKQLGRDDLIWKTHMENIYETHLATDIPMDEKRNRLQQMVDVAVALGMREQKKINGALTTLAEHYGLNVWDQNYDASRREFLTNSAWFTLGTAEAVTIGGTAVAATTKILSAPLVRELGAAVEASLARKMPESGEDSFEKISDAALEYTYNRYFKDRENIVSRKAWMGTDPPGFGRWIARLASIYYGGEKDGNESFSTYFTRFAENLYMASQETGLDFAILATSLKVSSENLWDIPNYKSDVFPVGILQMLGTPLANEIGKRYELQDLFQAEGPIETKVFPWLSEQLTKFGHPASHPKEGASFNSTIRIASEITTGLMDFESSIRAQALFLYGSDKTREIFKTQYPEITKRYQDILSAQGIPFTPLIETGSPKSKETLASTKQRMEEMANDYIKRFGTSLDVFALSDNALIKIGIGYPPDPWQKLNRTDLWYQLVRPRGEMTNVHQVEAQALNDAKETMHNRFKNNRAEYYKQLMSQQILNPKFLDFLIEQAEGINTAEVYQLKHIQEVVRIYEVQTSVVRETYLKAITAESPLEYHSRFQALTTAITTQMLSRLAGPFNSAERDSVFWNVYKVLSIRELSHPRTMVENKFANDVLVDPPYAMEQTITYINAFEKLLLTKGILKQSADKDILAMDKAIWSIRFNDFSAYQDVDLTDADKKMLYEFCKNYISEGNEVAINRSHTIVEII